MLNKFVIGINNSKFGIRVLFSVRFISGPYVVRNKEIVVFDFSSEGEFGNAEVSISVPEIVVIFGVFVQRSFPSGVISSSINRVIFVFPSFIESLDLFNSGGLSTGKN